MMTRLRHILFLCLASLGMLWTSCSDDERPDNLPPSILINEATEVTRTSALLSGEVIPRGNGTVSDIHFRYGTTEEMEQTVACPTDQLLATIRLTGLKPGTTYQYCLEAGNGYSTVSSETYTFTTQPNVAPSINPIRLLSQGPLSITVAYDITDDGGEPITSTGLYYRKDGDTEEQCLRLTVSDTGTEIRAHLDGLQMETEYILQAYAANSIGETRSDLYRFHTSQAITLTEAGTLPEAVSENDKYRFNTLNIAGPLNGTDFRYLRDMMGRAIDGTATPGQLQEVNLTDATIVAGGESYDGHHYTQDHTVGSGLFAQCQNLHKLALPDNATTVEIDAFRDCSSLQSLRLPSALVNFSPSAGCVQLSLIEIPASCTRFNTSEGVLYDGNHTVLVWYPEGKLAQDFTLPETVQTVGDYAFRNAQVSKVNLPSSVIQMGQGAFAGAALTRIVLPEALSTVPYGCFQGCTRLEVLTLGSGITYLSEYAFDGCTTLTHLYVQATDFPPYCTEETFYGAEQLMEQGTLHVLAGYMTLYRNHRIWGKFKTIVEE